MIIIDIDIAISKTNTIFLRSRFPMFPISPIPALVCFNIEEKKFYNIETRTGRLTGRQACRLAASSLGGKNTMSFSCSMED
jgi:hypothetical protein